MMEPRTPTAKSHSLAKPARAIVRRAPAGLSGFDRASLPRDLTVGGRLRHERELLGMSIEEISRATRIPVPSLERLEADRFDDLPGEVFVRGFVRAYARTLDLDADEILAQYTSARRVPYVAPVPVVPGPNAVAPKSNGRRVGVALAFVLLIVLCTMALSFVLKPRGRDVPSEVSARTTHAARLV
jgi:hypothetical protein